MTTPEYYPDLKTISLERLKIRLTTIRLLPSQQLLLDNIDARFTCLEQNGIENLEQLQKALKTKSDVQFFAKTTGLPLDYLTILRREVNSYQPKPIDFNEFPEVNVDAVRKLRNIGIKNTEHLFPYVLTPEDRFEFAERNQIAHEELLKLTKLTDVSRTRWVGPTFARLLIESEYDTVEKIVDSNVEELYRDLVRVNQALEIYKSKFGQEDMDLWVTLVRDVPRVIQF